MALIALCKLNLQTRMRSSPLGLHVWFLVRPFVCGHTLYVRTAKALARLAWAFAVRLCDKYHNLMSQCRKQVALSALSVRRVALPVNDNAHELAHLVPAFSDWFRQLPNENVYRCRGEILHCCQSSKNKPAHWGITFLVFLSMSWFTDIVMFKKLLKTSDWNSEYIAVMFGFGCNCFAV